MRIRWDNAFKGLIKGWPHCLSGKGTLILQPLGKSFHSDFSAKNTISCASRDQEAPLALPSPSFSPHGWLDDCKMRKNRVCAEQPHQPAAPREGRCWCTSTARAQTARSYGCGRHAQANPGSLVLFAYMPWGCRLWCEGPVYTVSLHGNSKVHRQDIA